LTKDTAEPPETAVAAVPVIVNRLDEVVVRLPRFKINWLEMLKFPPARVTPFALLTVTMLTVLVAGISTLVVTGVVAAA
jgi:hypothetical protein